MLWRMLPVIRKGFAGIGYGTTSNAFVAGNMGALEVDENHVASVDWERLRVASGILYPPKVTVSFDATGKSYSFVQTMQDEEDGFAMTDDKVYAVLYETVLNRARLVGLRDCGESGSTTCELPDEWDNANVKAYYFATSKNSKMASDSRMLTMA